MFTIGICDDEADIRNQIAVLCTYGSKMANEEVKVFSFESGEAILEYCANRTAEVIDLLLLDIEMQGISGLETRDQLQHSSKIARIVFVTSHTEQMLMAFGMKTVGFLSKPISEQELLRVLTKNIVEKKEQSLFELPAMSGAPRSIRVECIYYFEADGNYTTIYYLDEAKGKCVSEVLVMKIGKLEEMLAKQSFVRVHKSYLVNLSQVLNLTDKVSFLDIHQTLTVGRKYKLAAREAFLEYVAGKVRERL